MNSTTTQTNEQATAKPQESPGPAAPGAAAVVLSDGAVDVFASPQNFAAAQRMARALCFATLLPKAYQGEENLPNCLIALELASRIGASVFMIMQNLDVIQGRPGWRSTFLIATVNASKRFTPLRFRFEGNPGDDAWGCRAHAKDRSDGEPCNGALITIGLAKAEGWYGRNGSKWRTMPEQMLMYRAAAFWVRVFCPELSLGLQTEDEVIDTVGEPVLEAVAELGDSRMNAAALEAQMRASVDTVTTTSAKTEPVAHAATSVATPANDAATAKDAPAANVPPPPSPLQDPGGQPCAVCGKPVRDDAIQTYVAGKGHGYRHPDCSPFAPKT